MFEPEKLSGADEREWTITLAAFNWEVPYFSKICYQMMGPNEGEPVAVFTSKLDAPAAVDGARMYFNPKTFFKYTLPQRVFIMVHEVCHCIMDHCGQGHEFKRVGYIPLPDGRRLPYEHVEGNICQDFVINALLVESNIGEFPKDGLLDQNYKGTDSWIDVYDKRHKKRPPPPPKGQPGKPCKQGAPQPGQQQQPPQQGQPGDEQDGQQQGHGGFDKHLPPGAGQGKDPGEAKQERSPEQWKEAVDQARVACEAQGTLPAGVKQFFKKMLEPKYDWVEDLKTKISRAVGNDSYTWDNLDPEFLIRRIGAPGQVGHGAGTVVVGVDTSGSIVAEPKTLDLFMGVLANILEDANPERVIALWCDSDVHREDELGDPEELNVVRAEGVGGGGGTSFVPVFDWVDANFVEPDVIIYLTDGWGTMPAKDPGCPVIWATITRPGIVKFPFGQEVFVPKQVA